MQPAPGQQDTDQRDAVKILLMNQGSQQATIIIGRSRGQTHRTVFLIGHHPTRQTLTQQRPASATVGDQIGMLKAVCAITMPLGPTGDAHQIRRAIRPQQLQRINRQAVRRLLDIDHDHVDLSRPQTLRLPHTGRQRPSRHEHNHCPALGPGHHGSVTTGVCQPSDRIPATPASR